MSQTKKFCGRCGARLDEATGLCPNCDLPAAPPHRRSGKWGWLIGLAAAAVIIGSIAALNYYGIISLPEIYFFEDVKEGFSTVMDRVKGGGESADISEEKDEAPDDETDAVEPSAAKTTEETEVLVETAPPTVETEAPTEATTEPTTQPTEAPVLEEVDSPVSAVSASSTLRGDVKSHDVWNLLDDDKNTNWCEGASGFGIGETIQFDFKDTYQLHNVRIRGGNRASERLFYVNGRPRDLTLTFSDGTSMSFRLTDAMESQDMPLSEPVMTSSLTITIDSVYEGSAHNGVDQDTVISDVSFDIYRLVYPDSADSGD